MAKSSKIRKSARGKDCTVRIPGVCNFNPETTIHAHKNGGGMGMKENDIFGARCCSACHDVIDGRNSKSAYERVQILKMFYEGIFRTQQQLLDEGLIECE